MNEREELAALRRLAELEAKAAGQAGQQPAPETPKTPNAGTLTNIGAGALKAASDIGSSILWPIDAAHDLIDPQQRNLSDLVAGTKPKSRHEQRKESLGQYFSENADPESLAFKGGEIAGGVAGTAGVGGALGLGAKAAGLARFAPALESGGLTLGAGATNSALANALARVGAGAAVGGASTALINPEEAGTGAALGAAIPGAAALGGTLGRKLGMTVSPEVAELARKAEGMGINIPADRLTNSKVLNAAASSLNYIPLSGRAGTEAGMLSQLNQAASRTMGEDTSNLAQALRSAKKNLGSKFDDTLKNAKVSADDTLIGDLASIQEQASRELVPDQAKVIGNQIDDILGKVEDGVIDGQAAYNLKRNLDRIAKRNSPEAHWAGQTRNALVDALNRSLGEDGAQAFGKVRQQYGNMKALGRYALNGAEGELSAARLGGMKDIRSPELQDVADIAAQFVKGRESPHGAAQRVFLGGLGAGAAPFGALPYAATAMALGRLGNTALNSQAMKKILTDPEALAQALGRRAELRALPSVLAAE